MSKYIKQRLACLSIQFSSRDVNYCDTSSGALSAKQEVSMAQMVLIV